MAACLVIRPVRVLVKGWGVVDVSTDGRDVNALDVAHVAQAIKYGVSIDDAELLDWEVETND